MKIASLAMVRPVAIALLVALWPGLAHADFYEARAYFRQGKFQKTLEVLDAIKAPPPELVLMRADCLASLERFPEALLALRDLLARFPNNSFGTRARRKELDLLDRMHDWAGLVDSLEKAIAVEPAADSPLIKELALAYLKAGKTDRAVALLEKTPTTRNLSLLVEILKDSKSLPAYLSDRERTFDGQAERARVLGTLFMATQSWAKAKLYLEKAPATEETLERRIEVAKALGDKAAQIALYQILLVKAPTRGTYYEKLGELFLAQGDPVAAQATWRKLLATQGATPETFTWLARVFLDHGMKVEALGALVQGRAALADPSLFHKEVAECQTALGNYEAACSEYLETAAASFEAVKEPLLALARSSDPAYKACAAALMKAVAARPAFPEYYFLADEVLRIHGFGLETQQLVDAMCVSFRGQPRELLAFAHEFATTGRREEALRVLDAVTRDTKDQDLWDGLVARATLLRQMGNPVESLATIDRLKSSGAGLGYFLRGETLRGEILLDDQHKYAEARTVFEGLVSGNPAAPDRPAWQLAIARAAFGMLDFAAARSSLENLKESQRPEVRQGALFLKGGLDQLEGKLEEAMEDFTAITMEDTGSRVANDALEAILFLTNHPLPKEEQPYLKAYFQLEHDLNQNLLERYLKDSAAIDPAKIPPSLRPDFLWLQGQAQSKQGQKELAIQSFELLLTKFADSPRAPQAMLSMADLFERDVKDPQKAAKYLKDYLLGNPTSLKLDEIRDRILKLSSPKG